jgi:hypothetical protein
MRRAIIALKLAFSYLYIFGVSILKILKLKLPDFLTFKKWVGMRLFHNALRAVNPQVLIVIGFSGAVGGRLCGRRLHWDRRLYLLKLLGRGRRA